MFLTLWNVYRFHADYAALDGFDPEDESGMVSISDRSPLDRWILSKVTEMADEFHQNFVSWDFHKAGRGLEDFVVNDLSNWYVRRSRRRLWEESDSNDKRACQHTLHEVLLIVCRLMAPISPFMPDEIHRGLTGQSAHLSDWPIGSDLVERHLPDRDFGIEQEMSLVRSLAEAGRRIRVESNRRQRLPCQTGWIVGGPDISRFNDILAEELNVEVLTTEADLDAFQKIVLEPNRKILGAKCRSDLPSVLAQLDLANPEELLLEIEAGIAALGGYEITMEDIEIRRAEKEGFAAKTLSFEEGDVSIVLDMHTDSNLLSKGLARDITRRIQAKRKELDLQVESTINLSVWVDGLVLENSDWEHVITETRAGENSLNEGEPPSGADIFEVDGTTVSFEIQ
jgi:isoleucyl-tRNA synthetase